MRILRNLVLREFLGIYLACIAGVTVIFLMVDFLDRVQRYVGEGGAPFELMLLYMVCKLPWIIYEITPLVLPLAALITLGIMNRRRELMAVRAAGFPVRAVFRPVFLFSLLVAAGLLLLGEQILPASNTEQEMVLDRIKRHERLRKAALRGEKPSEHLLNVTAGWYRGSKGVYRVERYLIDKSEIEKLVIFETGKGFRVNRCVEAENVKWLDNRWVAARVLVRSFTGGGEVTTRLGKNEKIDIPETPEDFETMDKDAGKMGIFDLLAYIEKLEAAGSDMTSFKVDLWAKVSYPLSGFILLVLVVPLGLRSGREVGVAGGIVLALVICLTYYELNAWTLSLGRGGAVSTPWISAWVTPAVFGLAAIPAYLRSN